MRRQDLYCDSGHDIGLFLSQKNVSRKGEMNMLTLLFSVWLLYATWKLAVFAIRAGWGIFKILLSVVFLPVMIVIFLIAGMIQLTMPLLVIIGICTVVKELFGKTM